MNEHQRVEEQEVRELIAGAGPRAAVPAEDVVTIKAAAREQWQRTVERERRRRRGLRLRGGLALAASVLLAAVVGWWWSGRPTPSAPPIVASVELLSGAARVGAPGGGEPVALAAGGELVAGSLVETGRWAEGPPVAAALRLAGGESLRLAADTSVRLVSARRFELRSGALYVDSGATAAAPGVEVLTVLGTVRDIGTQFEVRLSEGDAALRVRVREGECSLEAGGDRYLAGRGEQLSLLGDGSLARARVEPWAADWDWVLAAAPSIDIEGRSLDAVLAWVARETGRQVRFADPALAQAAAAEIVVRGSAAGFTPDQTLAAVVASSGLRHEIENGAILIRR